MTEHTEKHSLDFILREKAFKAAEDKLKADLEALGSPIKIVIKNGKIEFMICGCKNYSDFAKYTYEELFIDERQRKHYARRTGIACARCNAVLTEDQLNKQLYGQKKLSTEQEAQKTIPEREGIQNDPKHEAKTGV